MTELNIADFPSLTLLTYQNRDSQTYLSVVYFNIKLSQRYILCLLL